MDDIWSRGRNGRDMDKDIRNGVIHGVAVDKGKDVAVVRLEIEGLRMRARIVRRGDGKGEGMGRGKAEGERRMYG
jgi:hypothetical protein